MTGYFSGLAARSLAGEAEDRPAVLQPRLPSFYEPTAGDQFLPTGLSSDSSDGADDEPPPETRALEPDLDVRKAVQQIRHPNPTIRSAQPRRIPDRARSHLPVSDFQPTDDNLTAQALAPTVDEPNFPALPLPERQPDPTLRVEVAGTGNQPTEDRESGLERMSIQEDSTYRETMSSRERPAIEPSHERPTPRVRPERVRHQPEGEPLIPDETSVDPAESLAARLTVPDDEPVEPVIRVSIGRIEIRAAAPAPPPASERKPAARPAPGRRPALTLDDYLERRNGGDT